MPWCLVHVSTFEINSVLRRTSTRIHGCPPVFLYCTGYFLDGVEGASDVKYEFAVVVECLNDPIDKHVHL